MECSRGGFLYAGRLLMGSDVTKIGYTTSRNPAAYVRRRYAGILVPEALIMVMHAPNAERIVHDMFAEYRHEGEAGRELFVGLCWERIQAAFEFAATVVANEERMITYFSRCGLLLEGTSRMATCTRETFDEND